MILTPFITIFLVNVVTSFFKKVIFPKFGATGIQIVLFLLSLIAAFVVYYMKINNSFAELLKIGGAIFAGAMVLYEILLKKFSVFAPTE